MAVKFVLRKKATVVRAPQPYTTTAHITRCTALPAAAALLEGTSGIPVLITGIGFGFAFGLGSGLGGRLWAYPEPVEPNLFIECFLAHHPRPARSTY